MKKPEKPKIDIRPEVGFGDIGGGTGSLFFFAVVVGLLFLTCVGG